MSDMTPSPPEAGRVTRRSSASSATGRRRLATDGRRPSHATPGRGLEPSPRLGDRDDASNRFARKFRAAPGAGRRGARHPGAQHPARHAVLGLPGKPPSSTRRAHHVDAKTARASRRRPLAGRTGPRGEFEISQRDLGTAASEHRGGRLRCARAATRSSSGCRNAARRSITRASSSRSEVRRRACSRRRPPRMPPRDDVYWLRVRHGLAACSGVDPRTPGFRVGDPDEFVLAGARDGDEGRAPPGRRPARRGAAPARRRRRARPRAPSRPPSRVPHHHPTVANRGGLTSLPEGTALAPEPCIRAGDDDAA